MGRSSKEQNKKYHRTWYVRKRSEALVRVAKYKAENREWFRKLKNSLACQRCAENHPACLDFHHRDPEKKEIVLSRAVTRGWSRKRIEEEIRKCDVLCSNCHRKEHFIADEPAGS